MAINVKLPRPFRRMTQGQTEIVLEGQTIRELLDDLEEKHPGIQAKIFSENNELRRFINVYVNNEDIRFLNGLQTAVKETDKISIISAIAGG
ncbi:sulfur carrier protein CysO [bacterium BMS3Abin05]|nr:sulfur carrier protein CysO [bacterium BMS3Abin05]GBE28679.1 sulfur carrier protein CysO [bacterium BMS3Bbin03]HDL78757.1 MoaD/ThiS family protein [Bacteroidota bacterium]HDZ11678.1 MoaD/ThiS family protein [Bacteroidota bacterium]